VAGLDWKETVRFSAFGGLKTTFAPDFCIDYAIEKIGFGV
jgi:hypothetical protein